MREPFCEEIFIQILNIQNRLKWISSKWRANRDGGLGGPEQFFISLLPLVHFLETEGLGNTIWKYLKEIRYQVPSTGSDMLLVLISTIKMV